MLRELPAAGRALLAVLTCLLLLLPAGSAGADERIEITVADALMDLHTGPGRGFPVFHVAERGETIVILKRQTDWFKVRTAREIEGWVSRAQILAAASATGVPEDVRRAVLGDSLDPRTEVGFGYGRFSGDPVVSFRAAYSLTDNLVAEADIEQVSGSFSGSHVFTGGLQIQPYGRARISPFLGLGAGLFQNRNRASLVGSTRTLDTAIVAAAAGVRFHVTKSLLLRADYRQYLSLTRVQNNDRFSEVQIGLSFLF